MLKSKLTLLRTSPLAQHFAPQSVERGWPELWTRAVKQKPLKSRSVSDESRRFSMILPPPNVTGELHAGHALTASIQDAVIRRKRMLGLDVMWLPGLDHAGIATQAVVERSLSARGEASRMELGREEFVNRVWLWKKDYGHRIGEQLRRIGASLDWHNEFFSLDQPRTRAVELAFVRLFDDGLVFRTDRLVMWCVALQTVISDIEVDHEELAGRALLRTPAMRDSDPPVEFGVIHDVAYRLADNVRLATGADSLVVSTTRPETLFADAALAVHPDDPRYASLPPGARVCHPLTGQLIPVVRDATLVDPTFGTGVVKVTPAHDVADYACGQRHGLPVVRMFELDGRANAVAGAFAGTDRLALRALTVAELQRLGAHRGSREHATRVPRCSRTGDILEPLPLPQWYVRSSALAKRASDAAKTGELEVVPQWQTSEWTRWLDKCEDWCVSRQLWWGHRVPAYCALDDATGAPTDRWTAALSEDEARRRLGCNRVQRDEDVLDTWFAASLLPLAALGWPDAASAPVLQRHYPLSLMETGSDIIFFWAARMAMMCTYLSPTRAVPFQQLLLHAMVRDAKGRKMSKSLGNVINPLHVQQGATLAELCDYMSSGNLSQREKARALESLRREYPNGMPQCGTDALRMSLLLYTEQARSINLDIARVYGNTKFCNKMWNAARLVLDAVSSLGGDSARRLSFDDLLAGERAASLIGVSPMSRWILARLAALSAATNADFDAYRLSQATGGVQRSFVEEFCDVFVEACKPALRRDAGDPLRIDAVETLSVVFEGYLRLLHPMAPFITEELWHRLLAARGLPAPASDDDVPTLMLQSYPTQFLQRFDETSGALAIEVTKAIRSLEAVAGAGAVRHFTLYGGDAATVSDVREDIVTLARLREPHTLSIAARGVSSPPEGTLQRASAAGVVVGVVTEVNESAASSSSKQPGAAALTQALESRLKRLRERHASGSARMAAPQYVERVPAAVRERDERDQQALLTQIAETEAELAQAQQR